MINKFWHSNEQGIEPTPLAPSFLYLTVRLLILLLSLPCFWIYCTQVLGVKPGMLSISVSRIPLYIGIYIVNIISDCLVPQTAMFYSFEIADVPPSPESRNRLLENDYHHSRSFNWVCNKFLRNGSSKVVFLLTKTTRS